eukprot:87623_1
MPTLKTYTWEEVAKHNTIDDCWVVINYTIYDVTSFLRMHPGGIKALLQVSGTDATHAFYSYHKHSPTALKKYGKQYVIGIIDSKLNKPSTSNSLLSCGSPPGQQAPELQPQPTELPDESGPSKHPEDIRPPSTLSSIKNAVIGTSFDVFGKLIELASMCVVEPLAAAHKFVRPIRGIPRNADGSATRIAIVGAGCAGLGAAYLLNKTEGFDVTVYESMPQVGGHAYTFEYQSKVKTGNQRIYVDMGYIFSGYYTYSNIVELMAEIGAEPVDSELSTLADVDGYQYASDSAGICRETLSGREKDPLWMHPDGRAECARFQRLCERFYDNPLFNLMPFHVFLSTFGFSQSFRNLYLKPTLVLLFIGEHMVFDMPSRLIFNMFAGDNKQADLIHGFPCFTIKDGTNDWLQKLCKTLPDKTVYLNSPVRSVERVTDRGGNAKVIVTADGEIATKYGRTTEVYDHVLFCCGAKAAALTLMNKSYLESYIFNQIRYETGAVMVLHDDESFIKQFGDTKNLRNFNYRSISSLPQCEVNGFMHQISQQDATDEEKQPILTFNPLRKPKGEIFHEKYCVIHQEDLWHLIVTRMLMPSIQGSGNVWYGASWTNWIGHASALDAGMVIATRLGANYTIKSPVARDVYFDMAARDMLGPRFDWRTSVRDLKPRFKSKL